MAARQYLSSHDRDATASQPAILFRSGGDGPGVTPRLLAGIAGIFPTSRRWIAVLVGLTLGAAGLATPAEAQGTPGGLSTPALQELKAQFRRPDSIPFPPENPYTDDKAKLGELLFFDPRLSGTGNMSCASCHTPSMAWSDAVPKSIGGNGKPMARRSQTLLNLAWTDIVMWDGHIDTLEEQVAAPLLRPHIMGLSDNAVPAFNELASMPGYKRLFDKVFPGEPINLETVSKAIATYERTLVSNKAPFDRWIEGDEAAIPEGAKRGFVLFNGKARCALCHNTWRFTDDGFHDIGIDDDDPGRGRVLPEIPVLQHAFKTPTLRNVAQRPPYMHDGQTPSLEAVIKHYATGFVRRDSLSPDMKPLDLTTQDARDLIDFMHTLTSEDDPVPIPVLPNKETM